MLDFWELLGRIAAEDVFRGQMLAFPVTPLTVGEDCDCQVVFSPDNYDKIRALVAASHAEIPVSLSALGEWMLIKTLSPLTQVLGDIATYVKAAVGSTPSKDRQFYQALGLSIIDTTFATTFNGSNLGFKLSASDTSVIVTLNLNTPKFRAKSKAFHDLFWGTDCKAWMFRSNLPPVNHAHPLDPDEQTLFEASKK